MAITFSESTPAEPDWRRAILDLKATVEIDRVLAPVAASGGVVAPADEFLVVKFCGTKLADVRAVLDRVTAANKEVGTPADNQTPHDNTEMNLRRLGQFGCAQAAVVSYASPGVYVVWSAYKYGASTKTEYRCAVWLCVLRAPAEISYLVGDRYNASGVTPMFFRRHHIVRAVHARAPVYYAGPIAFDGQTFLHREDESYPEFVTGKASAVFQTIAYAAAEELATSDDVDAWLAHAGDGRWPQASRRVMAAVVEAYSVEKLAEAQKL